MPFEIDAVVLLPDHLHILMRPLDGTDYSALWRLIKTRFSQSVTRALSASDPAVAGRRAGERGIWQRRFYEHTIRDGDDWGRHMDYIHFNPVKHGLVESPSDWPWSSLHRYVRRGWLDRDWPGGNKISFPKVPE
jgi:putative transposase